MLTVILIGLAALVALALVVAFVWTIVAVALGGIQAVRGIVRDMKENR
jgi:hypothetical protein